MTLFKAFGILIYIFINYQVASSQVSTASTEWAKQYNGGSSSDAANFIAVDNHGFIYVTGYSSKSGFGYDIVTVKYNVNGDSIWVRRYNGSANGDDGGVYIAIDSLDNIYVVGFTANSGTGASDLTTIKYSSGGNQLWVRNYNGPGNSADQATSIVLDSQSNVYVSGYSIGNGTGEDFATLKYNSSGSLQWVRRYNGPGNGNDQAKGLVIDNLGNSYVTGFSAGIGTGSSDFATIKYSPAGDSLWVKRYNGTSNGVDQARAIGKDPFGNIYVTGYGAQTGTGSSDYVTIKYGPTGDSIWVKKYNGTGNSTDEANSIKVDNMGNSFLTGVSVGSGSGNDFATIKYNTSGNQEWIQRYSLGSDIARYLILDSLNNVYVTGSTDNNFLTVKYNSIGFQQWTHTYHSSYEYSYCIAIDHSRNLFACGYRSDGLFTSANYLTLRISQQTTIKVLIEGLYNQFTDLMLQDTVIVYLRNSYSPYTVIDSGKYLLSNTGSGNFRFHQAPSGQYYLQVKHRNSIETWSPVILPFNTMLYEFTTAASQAYGSNQVLKGTKYCIYSGDVNQDGTIDATDIGLIDNDAYLGLGGYIKTDLNGDFFIDGSDLLIADNNAIRFVSVVRP